MDILMVTDTYAPARNGVATWVSGMVRDLRARSHDCEILTYAHERRRPGPEVVYELPAWFGVDPDFKVAPILSGLPEELEESRWDVVHVHHPVFLGPPGVGLARRRGAKVVFTCHSVYTDYLDEYALGLAKPLKSVLARRVAAFANRCDVVLAPSTHVGRWLRDLGVDVPIELVEAPADTRRVVPVPRQEARARLGLASERVALFVGRISEEKRVDLLVREFAVAAARVPDAVLVLAGVGGRANAVRRGARALGLDSRVRLLGGLDGEELGTWYSAAECVVSASASETGPLTVVEAMACGTPSVSFHAPGFEDRVIDGVNGVLAEERAGALGEALASLLGDEELRRRMSVAASERAARYTSDAVTDRLLEVYGGLLG